MFYLQVLPFHKHFKVGSIQLILDSLDLRTEEQSDFKPHQKQRRVTVTALKKHGYSFAKRLVPNNVREPGFLYRVNFEAGKGQDDSYRGGP